MAYAHRHLNSLKPNAPISFVLLKIYISFLSCLVLQMLGIALDILALNTPQEHDKFPNTELDFIKILQIPIVVSF